MKPDKDNMDYKYHQNNSFKFISMSKPSKWSNISGFISELMRSHETRYLCLYVVLQLLFFSIELIYGSYSNSLGLISDSFHKAFHCFGLCISIISMQLSKKQGSSLTYSYGYKRHEVLAAFSNSVFLVFVSMFLLVEGFHRMMEPPMVGGGMLVQVALVGLVINLIGAFFFRKDILASTTSFRGRMNLAETNGRPSIGNARDANIRGVLLHIYADTASSLGVVFSSWLVQLKRMMMADSAIALLISILILTSCIPLCKSMGLILLQTCPVELKGTLEKCLREASTVEGVLEYHNEHFWTQAPGCYVGTLNVRVHRNAKKQIVMANVHRIFAPYLTHLTIQVEKDPDLDWLAPVHDTI